MTHGVLSHFKGDFDMTLCPKIVNLARSTQASTPSRAYIVVHTGPETGYTQDWWNPSNLHSGESSAESDHGDPHKGDVDARY